MTKFTVYFTGAFLAILTLLAVSSIVIDPYAMFGTARVEGLNKYKLTAINYMRVVKPYHVGFRDYDVLITGSSRIGQGLDCRVYTEQGLVCYNSALPGGGIYEAYRFLQQRPESISKAIISLEFFVFLRENLAQPEFEERRLMLGADGSWSPQFVTQSINDLYGLLFASQTLRSSKSTWKRQNAPFTNPRADGMLYLDNWGGWNFDPSTLDSSRPNVRVNRQVSRFKNVLDTMKAYHFTYSQDLDQARANMKRQLGSYRDILEVAYQHDIQVKFVLPPSHASYWMIIRYLGLYPVFEQWKKSLVRLNEKLARHHAREPYPIFDFSGANNINLSPPPVRGRPNTFSQLFNDTMHFSSQVGEEMLERLSGECVNKKTALFGHCLTGNNINRVMRRQESRFKAYEKNNKKYLASIFPAQGDI